MATSSITSALLSQIAGSPSAANQFLTDLNQVAKDLEGGNLSAAQEDYVPSIPTVGARNEEVFRPLIEIAVCP